MKLSDKELRKRDAARDIGAEILQAVRDVKAGRGKRVSIIVSPAAAARQMSALSQADFAGRLGVIRLLE
jgi:putative transcriptional regulator